MLSLKRKFLMQLKRSTARENTRDMTIYTRFNIDFQ